MYSVRGRTAATAATADHACATLWNPHSTHRIRVVQISLCASAAPSAGCTLKLRRATARGTAGSTVTPGVMHHSLRAIAPPSGAVLDLAAYTTQPTFETGDLGLGWVLAAVAAAGVIYPIPNGIEIPPGAGLSITTGAAIAIPASDVTFFWLEDW